MSVPSTHAPLEEWEEDIPEDIRQDEIDIGNLSTITAEKTVNLVINSSDFN